MADRPSELHTPPALPDRYPAAPAAEAPLSRTYPDPTPNPADIPVEAEFSRRAPGDLAQPVLTAPTGEFTRPALVGESAVRAALGSADGEEPSDVPAGPEADPPAPPAADAPNPPPPPVGPPPTMEQPGGREPVDPGFGQYDHFVPPPAEMAYAAARLSQALPEVFRTHRDFTDYVEVQGRIVGAIELEARTPETGGRVDLVASPTALSVTGARNPELLTFGLLPIAVVRTSLDRGITANIPPQGDIPARLARDLTTESLLAQSPPDETAAAEQGLHFVGADEIDRAVTMLREAEPKTVTFNELHGTISRGLASPLDPEFADSNESGSVFTVDVFRYLVRDGQDPEPGTVADARSKVGDEATGGSLQVAAGFRVDFGPPEPEEPEYAEFDRYAVNPGRSRIESFAHVTYIRNVDQAMVDGMVKAMRAQGLEADPSQFTALLGGQARIDLDFAPDRYGRLACWRSHMYSRGGMVVATEPVEKVLCDQAVQRQLRNLLAKPQPPTPELAII